jgi:hypothetical protein
VPSFLKGKGWVKIGAKHDRSESGTFNEYLDTYADCLHKGRHQDWGSYVPSVLERINVAEVRVLKNNRGRPAAHIRLKQESSKVDTDFTHEPPKTSETPASTQHICPVGMLAFFMFL